MNLKKVISFNVLLMFVASLFIFSAPQTAYAFDHTRLAEDSSFINVDAMDVAQIQAILKKNGSFLEKYSQNGRSAAQIIYDAAHGYGDASGKMNGIKVTQTISPIAILAMLQKEQSLITMRSLHEGALNAAMGYGCPDGGGCSGDYRGFTKQVENGAWQLRYNFERASGHGFRDYQVGKTQVIDGNKIKIANRATAALYRYTPHLGTNFTTYFNKWGGGGGTSGGTYNAIFAKVKAKPKNFVVQPGQKFTVEIELKNTGTAVWSRTGDNAVRLGTQAPQDRASAFLNGGNRITMSNGTAKGGKKAKFKVVMTAPATPGIYHETFQPVAENTAWFGEQKTITITVGGSSVVQSGGGVVSAASVSGSFDGYLRKLEAKPKDLKVSAGQSFIVVFEYRNNGTATWSRTGSNAVSLGTQNPQDRASSFLGGSNRIPMATSSVKPGKEGKFYAVMKAPTTPGTYVETFKPVAEGVSWFGQEKAITITVK